MQSPLQPTIQSQSLLLTRLPLEIRQQIYQYILGGKVIHFVKTSGSKIRHGVCSYRGKRSHLLLCRNRHDRWCYCDEFRSYGDEEQHIQRLPLLLACRQLYLEGIDILYSDNIINLQLNSFENFDTLGEIQNILLPQHFHAIRSLEISFLHSNSDRAPQDLHDPRWFEHWAGMCGVIASMKGLVNLQLWMNMDQGDPDGDRENFMTSSQEAQFFKPLLEVNWLAQFRVEVSWAANEDSDELLRDAPFELTRTEDKYAAMPLFPEVTCGNGFVR